MGPESFRGGCSFGDLDAGIKVSPAAAHILILIETWFFLSGIVSPWFAAGQKCLYEAPVT